MRSPTDLFGQFPGSLDVSMMGKANGHSRCVPCELGEALQTDFALLIDDVQRIPVGEHQKDRDQELSRDESA